MIVQSDRTLLLEVDHPDFPRVRDQLARFAELLKSPEHVHTYRITPLSLWNAASSGLDSESILDCLEEFSRYPIPGNISTEIRNYIGRYGRLVLVKEEDILFLKSDDPVLITEIWHYKPAKPFISRLVNAYTIEVKPRSRGHLKQALIKLGYPVKDIAGFVSGTPLSINLRHTTSHDLPFSLRPYQIDAIKAFHLDGSVEGGSGVVVLPCGAGKTMVGLGAISTLGCETLILVTNIVAIRQWRDEILDKSDLRPDLISEYSGERKEISPITIATYQILTYRKSKKDDFAHFGLFDAKNWGLIIYDEVHLLPAQVFRITAEIQARRRLGLTATLVREDGREDDVFSLIGPKRFDYPWKDLERAGWIATAKCTEIRVEMDPACRVDYAVSTPHHKFRLASENPRKFEFVKALLEKHKGDSVLIIGQYIKQVKLFARKLGAPIITGQTPNQERMVLYNKFRSGEIPVLVVSKVANFAIDLPDANVAIQISGTFGSRQEEAQRLGRILRPKKNGTYAYFYTLVTRETREQEFAANRQLFLTEQGYSYQICFEKIP